MKTLSMGLFISLLSTLGRRPGVKVPLLTAYEMCDCTRLYLTTIPSPNPPRDHQRTHRSSYHLVTGPRRRHSQPLFVRRKTERSLQNRDATPGANDLNGSGRVD
ncbi:uncharacterized protein EV422DRAFT_528216 [Fimicolochytrium jonesii]|uniref:uncharacterized protein n=1 Tax=Fimicolochytrium jonesii TaxID=1396493 RepID=UPI0022FE1628|nr:uncharacterized protein EV422DRAFT_528216 [Fimicolochytrium jonesii]KAI8821463.1 hypothetical protein EV422DRAFT_528216 [Fimicolochytrium jonesii]